MKPVWLLAVGLVLGSFGWIVSACAADTVILLSSGATLFIEAEEGVRSTLKGNALTFVMDNERDPEAKKLIRKLRDEPMDILIVVGSPAMQLAVKEFKQIPLVFCFVLDYAHLSSSAVEAGGAEVSGITMSVPPGEQLKALLAVKPQTKRVGIVYDRSKSSDLVEQARKAAKQAGISLVALDVDSNEAAINAISQLPAELDAYIMLPDSTVLTPELVKHLLLFSFKNQIALVGLAEKYVRQGALLALSFESRAIGRQAGELANDRMANATGSKLKIVDPRALRLSVNRNTAEQLHIKIPESIVQKAQVF